MAVRKVVVAALLTVFAAAVALVACVTESGGNFLVAPPGISGVSSSASAPAVVLPLEVDIAAAETFVRIGFGLESGKHFQATSFMTTRLRTVQAQQLIRIVKSYNDFEGEKVAAALGRFRGKVSAVEFGRSGSPLLYIELPHWTHQREETIPAGMGTRISEELNQQLVEELRQTFVVELNARDFSENKRRVRIWWH